MFSEIQCNSEISLLKQLMWFTNMVFHLHKSICAFRDVLGKVGKKCSKEMISLLWLQSHICECHFKDAIVMNIFYLFLFLSNAYWHKHNSIRKAMRLHVEWWEIL